MIKIVEVTNNMEPVKISMLSVDTRSSIQKLAASNSFKWFKWTSCFRKVLFQMNRAIEVRTRITVITFIERSNLWRLP